MGVCKGIEIEVSAGGRARLKAIAADRNARQKHVERAQIVLSSADGVGTVAIMRRVGCQESTAGVMGCLQSCVRPVDGRISNSRARLDRHEAHERPHHGLATPPRAHDDPNRFVWTVDPDLGKVACGTQALASLN